jgi:SAM-dependent methyltransferase
VTGLRLPKEEFDALKSRDYRLAWLMHDLNEDSTRRGLEIGALNNPTPVPNGISVEYVDYASTEHLQQFPHEATVRRADIVNVDHVWPGSGSLAQICGRADYDFVIASHVIEHVPNVLGWFEGIYGVLRPGGVFNLAIPDCRYTFDIRRKTSTLGEMLEAYLHSYTKPSVRQLFDHTYDAAAVALGAPWSPTFDLDSVPRYSGDNALELALAQSRIAIAQDHYFDSHCWIFTPRSFLDRIEGAIKLGLFAFVISDIAETQRGSFEFFVSFRKDESVKSDDELQNLRLAAVLQLQNRVGRRESTPTELPERRTPARPPTPRIEMVFRPYAMKLRFRIARLRLWFETKLKI